MGGFHHPMAGHPGFPGPFASKPAPADLKKTKDDTNAKVEE